MDSDQTIAPLCVYTITHSERLRYFYNLGGRGELSEGKRWVRAEMLLRSAGHFRMSFPIIFAAAEDTDKLIFHAILDTVRLFPDRDARTDYTFSELTPFPKPLPAKTSLINDATGQAVPRSFTRPYLICRTPACLLNG